MRYARAFAVVLMGLAISAKAHSQTSYRAAFVTRLSEDRIAMERFTRAPGEIESDREGGDGAIRLQWDRTEAYVPFQVPGG